MEHKIGTFIPGVRKEKAMKLNLTELQRRLKPMEAMILIIYEDGSGSVLKKAVGELAPAPPHEPLHFYDKGEFIRDVERAFPPIPKNDKLVEE